jgi:hypothetical protein
VAVSLIPARYGALLVAVAVGCSALLSGCSGSASNPDGDETEPVANEVTVPIPPVQTHVLDAGAEPRMRMAPIAVGGTLQRVTLHTENGVQQQVDNQPDQDFSTPPLTMPLEATTSDDGADLVLGRIACPDAELEQALTAAEGSHAGLSISPNGAITALQITPPTDASDAARRAVEQAFYQAVYHTVVFPDDDLGVGAVWVIEQQISGGVTLDQVTTATLLARDDDVLTIGVEVRQTPRSDVWNLPNGAGMLDIEQYDMHGSGQLTIDLGRPLPVAGIVTMAGKQSYRVPNDVTRLNQSTSSIVQWTP